MEWILASASPRRKELLAELVKDFDVIPSLADENVSGYASPEALVKTLAELKAKEVRLIDPTPRYGAGNARIAFVHPKATGGVLLELTQRM